MQIIGKEVLPIANAEHLPYDAILGKEHDLSKYPKDNQLEASNIIKKIENAVSSMSKDDRV